MGLGKLSLKRVLGKKEKRETKRVISLKLHEHSRKEREGKVEASENSHPVPSVTNTG